MILPPTTRPWTQSTLHLEAGISRSGKRSHPEDHMTLGGCPCMFLKIICLISNMKFFYMFICSLLSAVPWKCQPCEGREPIFRFTNTSSMPSTTLGTEEVLNKELSNEWINEHHSSPQALSRSWGWSSHEWYLCLYKRDPRELCNLGMCSQACFLSRAHHQLFLLFLSCPHYL